MTTPLEPGITVGATDPRIHVTTEVRGGASAPAPRPHICPTSVQFSRALTCAVCEGDGAGPCPCCVAYRHGREAYHPSRRREWIALLAACETPAAGACPVCEGEGEVEAEIEVGGDYEDEEPATADCAGDCPRFRCCHARIAECDEDPSRVGEVLDPDDYHDDDVVLDACSAGDEDEDWRDDR